MMLSGLSSRTYGVFWMHLFLSPHADDAALSCGAQIAMLTRSGERVIIFTVMAGDPPNGLQPSDYTPSLHQRWELTDDTAVSSRRKENTTAGKKIGAGNKFGPDPDAVY